MCVATRKKTARKKTACKRPYSLGKRLEQSDQKRVKILSAAQKSLESDGFRGLTLDVLAQDSGVTRQTVYNLFKNKTGILEALFDQLALRGGMNRMPSVMQQTNPEAMLTSFVEVFSSFWSRNRLLLRRIHGIAAMDPDFATVLQARNRRRKAAATRVVEMLDRRNGRGDAARKEQRIPTLHALTSFEFFDTLAESCGSAEEAALLVSAIVKKALSVQQ